MIFYSVLLRQVFESTLAGNFWVSSSPIVAVTVLLFTLNANSQNSVEQSLQEYDVFTGFFR